LDGKATLAVTDFGAQAASPVALTRHQQARIIRSLCTATAWRPLHIAATSPLILVTTDPGGCHDGMDRRHLHFETRLDYGIPILDSAELGFIRERCK
jgi:hypothetical protein